MLRIDNYNPLLIKKKIVDHTTRKCNFLGKKIGERKVVKDMPNETLAVGKYHSQ